MTQVEVLDNDDQKFAWLRAGIEQMLAKGQTLVFVKSKQAAQARSTRAPGVVKPTAERPQFQTSHTARVERIRVFGRCETARSKLTTHKRQSIRNTPRAFTPVAPSGAPKEVCGCADGSCCASWRPGAGRAHAGHRWTSQAASASWNQHPLLQMPRFTTARWTNWS